jgi:hypothetical protein
MLESFFAEIASKKQATGRGNESAQYFQSYNAIYPQGIGYKWVPQNGHTQKSREADL